MAIARKIAYNVVFNIAAKFISTALALVGIGLITRYLGTQGFGDYSTVLAFFAFFGSAADLGLYSITAREISRPDANEEKILANAFTFRIISSLAVFALTPLLVYYLPYSYEVKLGIIIAAASFVFSSTYVVLNGVFQKNLAMDKVSSAEVLGKIIQITVIVLAVKNDWGFIAIVLSILAAMFSNFLMIMILVRRYTTLTLDFDFAYWKKFIKEAAPLGVSALVIFIYFKIDTILLSIIKTNTEVGIYNAAYKVIENIAYIPSMITGLVFPMFSKHIFTDKEQFANLANKTLKVFFILVIPLVIGTMFLSDGIIRLIGGSAFADSSNTLRILIFALAFIFFGGLFNNILIASNHQKKMLLALVGCAAFNITANIILIPKFSYTAAAIVSVSTEFLAALAGLILIIKYVKYTPKIENFFRIIISGLCMGIFLFIFKDINFYLLAVSSAFVYFIFLWLTKTVTAQELASIFSRRG